MISKRCLCLPSRHLSTNRPPIEKARLVLCSHTPQLLDRYWSFSKQAAQAMGMKVAPFVKSDESLKTQDENSANRDIDTSFDQSSMYPIWSTPERRFLGSVDSKDGYNQDSISSSLSYKYDRFTVNKSPHAHGRHQDQFEIRDYQRQMTLIEDFDHNLPSTELVNRWLHYVAQNLPAGIGMRWHLNEFERVNNKVEAESPR